MSELWHKHLRPMFKYIEQNYDLTIPLKGIEIGVKGGRNAYYILTGLPIKILYLIDCYDEKCLQYKPIMEQEILNKYPEKTHFIYKKSIDAINDVPKDLDFVYIDSDHTYETTKNEIKLYYEKVRKGGILGGHDYGIKDIEIAVQEFVQKNKLKLYIKYDRFDPDSKTKRAIDWWVIKQ